MAFPIKPKRRSGASGNPTTLEVGELAVNTFTGELFLGGDSAVMLINSPLAAGTTVSTFTGDGTTVAFASIDGYTTTDAGAYLVSVGGLDQRPGTDYTISATAGGTITFATAPRSGEVIVVRAIQAGGGGGGSGNATQIQGRNVASTAPTDGQVLAWNDAESRWEPTSINGSVTFNTPGSHSWAVPAWVRWVYVSAAASNGSNGTATNGQPGEVGASAYFDGSTIIPATTGAVGANGTASAGAAGQSITVAALSLSYAGGTAGQIGIPGYGGGGSGGAGYYDGWQVVGTANGGAGAGPYPGQGGLTDGTPGAGGGTASSGSGSTGGSGANNGGSGGNGNSGGGGGGGGDQFSGGGGGASAGITAADPGYGGVADTSMCAGGAGDTFAGAMDLSAVAGTTISIVISEGAGNASITFTY